jgi:hypothetical protein
LGVGTVFVTSYLSKDAAGGPGARRAIGLSQRRRYRPRTAAKPASSTVKRFEAYDGVPPSRSSSLLAIRGAMEAAGIEFIGTPDDAPGIRVRKMPLRT